MYNNINKWGISQFTFATSLGTITTTSYVELTYREIPTEESQQLHKQDFTPTHAAAFNILLPKYLFKLDNNNNYNN